MTLDEAVHDIKARTGGMHHQVACHAFVHSFYSTEGKHLTTPVTFTRDARPGSDAVFEAKRKRTADQDGGEPAIAAGRIGAGVGGRVGGKRIMKLRGDVGDYYVGLDEDGDVALFQHVTANGSPGVVRPGGMTTDARRRRDADATWSRNALHSINEQNRRFWKTA